MELKRVLQNKVILLQDYLNCFDKMINSIMLSHQKIGFKRIYVEQFDNDFIYDKVDILKNNYLESFCIFNDEIKARSEALILLKEFVHIIKKEFSLHVEIGYLSNENVLGGFVYCDDTLIKLITIKIDKINNQYLVDIKYENNISEIVNYYLINYRLITSSYHDNYFGGVILDYNSHLCKLTIDDLIEKYNIVFPNKEMKTKDKYQYLEEEGYQYILEFRKNGKLKIKCVGLDIYQEIDANKINDFINETKYQIDEKLYNLSFKLMYEYLKKHQKCLCENCLNETKYLFKPFNQRITKNCENCSNKAIIKVIY